jgi:hypothetical protein
MCWRGVYKDGWQSLETASRGEARLVFALTVIWMCPLGDGRMRLRICPIRVTFCAFVEQSKSAR